MVWVILLTAQGTVIENNRSRGARASLDQTSELGDERTFNELEQNYVG